jgi:small multidrug resistance family-3 protein
MESRRLLVTLLVLSTGLFVLGVSIERSSRDGHSAVPQAGVAAEGEEGHSEEGGEGAATGTGESAEAKAAEEDEHAAEETALGVDLEATPLVALAAAGSLALAAGVWLGAPVGARCRRHGRLRRARRARGRAPARREKRGLGAAGRPRGGAAPNGGCGGGDHSAAVAPCGLTPSPSLRRCGNDRGMTARSIALFALAALAEIGGAYLVWIGVREHKGVLFAGAGVIALGAYGFVATLQPDPNFGRVLAAYGVFVVGSLAWGMVFDGFRPDRYDVVGALVCLVGVGVIMYAPR